MIRVLIVDDQSLVRTGFRMILEAETDVEVVGEAADGAEAVRVTVAERPDALVLDLAMPVMDGLEAIPEVLAGSPDTAIVVLSGFARGQLDREALARGARAYVEKGEAFSTIVTTLLDITAVVSV